LSLTLAADTVKATDVIRVLGVLFTADLALKKQVIRNKKQVISVSAKCFFQLRQLRRVRRSLDRDSAATLVQAFVTSSIDYGNAFLTNALKIWTEKLQRVLNAAACVITGTRKFDSSLSHILHHDLHWLDVPQRVIFKLCMTVYKCLHGLAPKYLPVADVAGRHQRRSASQGLLNFPRNKMSNYGRRAFCFAGPYVWNSLPEHIRQSTSTAVFKHSLKTFLLQQISRPVH